MKVIHLIGGGDTGGAKTHVLNLLRALNNSIDARLVCFLRGEFSEDARKMGIPITVIESGNPAVGLRELKKLLREEPVDIIHCHGARGNLMGNLVKGFAKAPVVTTVHSDYRLDYLGRPVAMLSYGATNMVALRRVNYYIGVADPMTDLLIQRNFPASRIYTLYNGIDFKTPLHPVSREEFFASVGMDVAPGDVVAGIAARLTPVKDYPTLLRAMQLACAENPRLKLIAAGDGEDREKLLALAKELGIAQRVHFAGWVQDMASFYNAIDINLLTSISETFPYVLTEGARMHRATIASNVGGVPMLIDHGENGFIFAPGSEKELAKYLLTLAGDEELRRRMGDRLYEKARQNFSIDRMVEHQIEIYESILAREKRRKERKRDGVIVCGAYGFGNAGDEAILKSIVQSLRGMDPYLPITVLAKKTKLLKQQTRVDAIYTLNIPKALWAMRRSRLFINGGGTLIQNATSQRSLWYYLFTLRAAKSMGNLVDMYGCGIGPVTGERNIRLVRGVLESSVDALTLREEDSLAELQKFGVSAPKIALSSDPAFALTPATQREKEAYFEGHGLVMDGKYLCFVLRTWHGFAEKAAAFAQCARRAYDRHGLTPVFLSLNTYQDGRAARQVLETLDCPYHLLDDCTEPELLIGVLGEMRAVISMRLHGLILSSISGVPLVGVAYDPKITSFIRYLGAGGCMDLADVTAEKLLAALEDALGQADRRDALRAKAQRLMEREQVNLEAVRQLLE